MHVARVIPAFHLVLAAVSALAAPPLTTIQDTLYNADGSLFGGNAEVAWRSFTASDGSYIVMNQTSLRIVNGALKVRLIPTVDATSAAYYTVRYSSDGRTMFTETWVVPASPTPLRVADVRVAAPPGGGGVTPSTVSISDVAGLAEALAARPTRGQGFTPGRAAVLDATGALSSASGGLGDCLRVDGTAGSCASGLSFVDMEVPSGAINGSNASFTLAHAPAPASSLHIYRNGILLMAGFDFTLSGSTLTFVAGAVPQSGDTLITSYRR